MIRIVFMGTPGFAAAQLEACLKLGEVVAVVTQPDKPKGRGQEVSVSEVKALALSKGLPVLQPPKIRNTPFASELAAYQAEEGRVTAAVIERARYDVEQGRHQPLPAGAPPPAPMRFRPRRPGAGST